MSATYSIGNLSFKIKNIDEERNNHYFKNGAEIFCSHTILEIIHNKCNDLVLNLNKKETKELHDGIKYFKENYLDGCFNMECDPGISLTKKCGSINISFFGSKKTTNWIIKDYSEKEFGFSIDNIDDILSILHRFINCYYWNGLGNLTRM